jgi:SWI/SNF-related matrix-associated actin-dependent regulator of chromatin subfamily A member 5
MARCHRIGQTKPVTVYRLVTQDSVEEQALTRLAKKLYLSVKVNAAASKQSSRKDDSAPSFSTGELVRLLRAGSTVLGSQLGDEWLEKSIEEILKESRERQRKREETLVMSEDEVDAMERDLLRDQERIKTNIFQGTVLSRSFREITDGRPP